MPKKNMTPEERKAFGEKMKVARAKSKDEKLEAKPEVRPETVSAEVSVSELQRQVEELKALIQSNQVNIQKQETPQMNQQGSLVGTFDKYVVDPRQYLDPRDRLSLEPRLARFAFPVNYELGWEITDSRYQTIDGIWTREPKFTIELNAIVRDEDTDEPTNGRYTIRKMIFHEDPQAAMIVARDNGIDIEEMDQATFLNEMRYLRARDWLLECFYPPKTQDTKKKKQQMVIGNQVVEYFEVSSSDLERMNFGDLKGKIKA